jgi:hypothetical protein
MDEGERDEGKDEKDGCRWRATGAGFWAAGGGGLDDEGAGGLCDATCIAAKAIVSIFTRSAATQACNAICGTER